MASSGGRVAISSMPIVFRAVAEIGPSSARRTSSWTPALEHRPRALGDPLVEDCLRHVEADDDGRVPRLARPEPVARRCERRTGLGELEGADDAAAVVRVHRCGGRRVDRGQALVRRLGAALVVERRPPLPALRVPARAADPGSASAARR